MIRLRWMPIRTIAIALATSGCLQTVTDTSCSAFGPITYSAAGDTASTVLQVRQHNAAWIKLCK